jgi:predicted metal-dependent phosphoesterase TrpH
VTTTVQWADFHLHSTCSDGSDAPEEVASRAHAHGARALALTDHDTTAGVAPLRKAATALGMLSLSGVEISTVHEKHEVHVIALGVNTGDDALAEVLERLRGARARRAHAIVERLKELGIDLAQAPTWREGESTGRMHIAAAMQAMGVVKRPQDAFNKYLNPGKAAFVSREKVDTAEALERIHTAGGLAFVAHPGLNRSLRRLLPTLLHLPFDGIEAFHTSHTPGRMEEFSALATARGLLITGGSDCHGDIKGRREMGRVRLPWRHADAILSRLA